MSAGSGATALLAALALCAAAHAAAAPKPAAVALSRLATRLADEVAAHGAVAPVAVYVRGEAPELAQAFGTVLAAALSERKLAPVPVDAAGGAQAEEAARERGARSLLRLTLSLENGLLQARGDLLGTWVNFWSGRTATRPGAPAAGLEGSTLADAHALALAAAPSAAPVATEPARGEVRLLGATFARLGSWSAALAAGDLDGDGKDEVVVLTDEELLAFAPDGRLIARRDHRAALPASTTPSREPFGAVAVLQGPVRVAYFSGRHSRGEQLALEAPGAGFRVLGPLDEAALGVAGTAAVTARLQPGLNVFSPELSVQGAAAPLLAPGPFVTASVFTGPAGPEWLVVAPDGTGFWRAGLGPEAASAQLTGLGAASALVDVDGDGAAELATTSPTFRPEPDALRILPGPAQAAQAGEVRFQKELPRGRALQLAAANLDGDLASEVIVAVWMADGTTELQLFRRAR